MAKIVILAKSGDADEASAALEGAGVDFEVVEPTAANLLHIVIGMVDDDEDEDDEDDEPKEPKEKKEPKEASAEEPEDELPPDESDIASDASAVPESVLGTVKIDGEVITAYAGKGTQSVLHTTALTIGARTTYSINESQFSFWPADAKNPKQRIVVEVEKHRSSVEVQVAKAAGGDAYLVVGSDIADLFKTK